MVGPRDFFAGWRGLGRFWLIVTTVLAASGVALQIAGPRAPPAPRPIARQAPTPASSPQGVFAKEPAKEKEPVKPEVVKALAQRPGRDTPGPVADPDPGLLEPLSGSNTENLPRIAIDQRMPMQVYAAGFDSSSLRPRVGLLLTGVGLNQADSETAIRTLPGGVSLAISPYAQNPAKLLDAARLAEHEYLVSIPMEPQGFPLNDAGGQALMTSLSPEQNQPRLEWVLSRFAGYVGATGAEAGLRGERFASLADELTPVLAARGLLYVDPRPGAARLPLVWSGTVDLVVDEPATAVEIDDKLARLARLAHEKGSALGLAGSVRPVTTQRLAAWANGLAADGLALAPVSALVQPPAAR